MNAFARSENFATVASSRDKAVDVATTHYPRRCSTKWAANEDTSS